MTTLKTALNYVKTLGNLLPAEKMLILYIIYRVEKPGDSLNMSTAQLGKAINLSSRTIQRNTNNLKEKGVLRIEKTIAESGYYTANSYFLPGWEKYNNDG